MFSEKYITVGQFPALNGESVAFISEL